MAPPSSTTDDSHQKLLDQLDIAHSPPRPFRNPNWKPSARRNKNVKQIISESSRREASALASQAQSGSSTPFGGQTVGGGTAGGAQTPALVSTTAGSAVATGTPAGDPTGAGSGAGSGSGSGPGAGAGAGARPPNIAQAAQNLSTLVLEKNFRSLYPPVSGPAVTYTNIESAPSLSAAQRRRYCDITGLPALYTDPKTGLRYHDKEVFGVVRSLGQGVPDRYLEARGAHTVLK